MVISPKHVDGMENSRDSDKGPRLPNFFMLNSIEHEIFLLLNVKMPTIVGILTFMSRKNSIFVLAESEES